MLDSFDAVRFAAALHVTLQRASGSPDVETQMTRIL
jgi:hypothetical protein